MNSRSIRLWLSFFLLILVASAIGQEPPQTAPPPATSPAVAVSQPLVREVADYEDFTGRTEAVQTVEVRARVTGYLAKVDFRAGTTVKQGDMLFEIDPRPYQAQLARCEAEARGVQARLKRLNSDLERATALVTKGALGRDEVERIAGDRAEAEAAVRVAEVGLELAKLNLEFTKVTASMSGKISRPLLDAGNVVVADTTPLAVLVSSDPICVGFDVDERSFLRLSRIKRESETKGVRELAFPVSFGLADEKGFPRGGNVESVDVRFDSTTGTIRCRAVFPNADGIVLPGMSTHVRLVTSAPYKALLVAERAIGREQGQSIVFVVGDQNTVERREVTLGPQHGALRAVKKGLTAEDWVIVGGLAGARPGMTVKPEKVAMPAQE